MDGAGAEGTAVGSGAAGDALVWLVCGVADGAGPGASAAVGGGSWSGEAGAGSQAAAGGEVAAVAGSVEQGGVVEGEDWEEESSGGLWLQAEPATGLALAFGAWRWASSPARLVLAA